jgi:hypothetical protein
LFSSSNKSLPSCLSIPGLCNSSAVSREQGCTSDKTSNERPGYSNFLLSAAAMSALPVGVCQCLLIDAALFAGTAGVVWAMAGSGFDTNSNAGKSGKRIKKDRARKLIACDLCSGKGKKACQFWFAFDLILLLRNLFSVQAFGVHWCPPAKVSVQFYTQSRCT